MTAIPGTNVGAPVVPYDTADSYPSHRALYGAGGLRTMATTAARNLIPVLRLEVGCEAYVIATDITYRLKSTWPGGIPPVDADWEVAVSSGGAGGTITGAGSANAVAYWTSGTNLGANVFFEFVNPATPGIWLNVHPSGIAATTAIPNIAIRGFYSSSTLGVDTSIATYGVWGESDYSAVGTLGTVGGGHFESSIAAGAGCNFSIGSEASANCNGNAASNIGALGEAFVSAAGVVTSNICLGAFANIDGTVTDNYGLRIEQPGVTGTVTNNYGIFVAAQTGGTNNWAIRTGTGLVEFDDNLRSHSMTGFGTTATFGLSGGILKQHAFEDNVTDLTAVTTLRHITNGIVINHGANSTALVNGMSTQVSIQAGDPFNLNALIGGANAVQHFGSGTVGLLNGFGISAESNSTGNVTTLVGASFQASCNGANTVTTSLGLQIQTGVVDAGGTVTTNTGLYVLSPFNVGTLTNSYGIFLEDQNKAATINYAIYSNAGTVHFSDFYENGNSAVAGVVGSVQRFADTSWTITDFSAVNLWELQTLRILADPGADSAGDSIFGQVITSELVTGNTHTFGGIVGSIITAHDLGTNAIGTIIGQQINSLHAGTGLATFNTGATINAYSSAAGNITTNVALQLQSGSGNAASTVHDDTTLHLQSPRNTGTLDNHIGLRIDDQEFGPNSYAITTDGGKHYFKGNTGFGNAVLPFSSVHIGGSLSYGLTFTSANYTVLNTDLYIGCRFLAGPITVTLPSILSTDVQQGKVYIVADQDANATVNNITVSTTGGETIISNVTGTSVVINTDGGSLTFVAVSNAEWKVI